MLEQLATYIMFIGFPLMALYIGVGLWGASRKDPTDETELPS